MTDLQATDWISLLLSVNIDVPIERSEFNTYCPFHADSQPSCSINVDKGVWICFAGCGQGSLHYFVKKLLHINDSELDDMLMKYDMFDSTDLLFNEPSNLPLTEVKMPKNVLYGYYAQWVLDRGFTHDELKKWNCVTSYNGDLIIPVYDMNNILVGTITRRQNQTPKYMYSKGLQKSKVLFGGHRVIENDFVCVVEGSLDAIWLSQLGYNVVGILGMSLSSTQEHLISQLPVKEVVLCLDNDEAGQIGLQQALLRMEKHMPTTYIEIPKQYKDVQDIKDSFIIDKLISTRVYF